MIQSIKKWWKQMHCDHKWLSNFFGYYQEGSTRVFKDQKTCSICDKVSTKIKITEL